MNTEPYYTLVSSLPLLPHFTEAEWLPLSRKGLEQRLSMLHPDHAVQLKLAEDLVKWQRQPITRTTLEVAEKFRRAMPQITHPALREFVEYRMAQRSALVALRMRRLGLDKPGYRETWGVGPWLHLINSSWDSPDLGLGHLLPWLEEAAIQLNEGAALELEALLMDAVWTRLGRISERSVFGFEPVIAFVFRWDILQRWMSYDAEKSQARFHELVAEVTREQQKFFA